MDTGGVEPWAYHIVGGVQLATHSWMSHPRMSSDELIDYLTMLSWSALCGIVEVGGSLEKFREMPHPSPILPRTVAQEMSKSDDLPGLWTHEPHDHAGVPRRRQGRRHRHQRHAGVQGQEGRRPRRCRPSATNASPSCRRCCTPTADAGDTPLGAACAAGHGHRGQGRNRQTRCRSWQSAGHPLHQLRRADRGGAQAPLPVADPQGAAAGGPHRGVRPLALRGRADRAGAQPGAARRVGYALRRDQQRSRRNSSTAA